MTSTCKPPPPRAVLRPPTLCRSVSSNRTRAAVVAAGSRSVINPSRVSNARSTNTPSSSLIHTVRPGRSSGASVRRAVTTTGTGLSASGASGASGASDTLNSISSAFHHAPTSPHRPKRTSDPGRFHPVSVIAVLSAQRSARPSAGGANDAGFVRSRMTRTSPARKSSGFAYSHGFQHPTPMPSRFEGSNSAPSSRRVRSFLTRATAPRPSFTVQGSGGAVAGAVVASSSSLSPVVREERAQPHASSGPRHAFTSLSTRDVENAKYFPSGVVPGSA
mmetsp:Transcript_12209/g.43928  ORF Transcript_12209/g.43928 Transcript_12209/m.43928 type:complete len:276 (+) Transcript_12209:330-1157(+)